MKKTLGEDSSDQLAVSASDRTSLSRYSPGEASRGCRTTTCAAADGCMSGTATEPLLVETSHHDLQAGTTQSSPARMVASRWRSCWGETSPGGCWMAATGNSPWPNTTSAWALTSAPSRDTVTVNRKPPLPRRPPGICRTESRVSDASWSQMSTSPSAGDAPVDAEAHLQAKDREAPAGSDEREASRMAPQAGVALAGASRMALGSGMPVTVTF
mmetsp:Transcript_70257/g.199323  ORF Transcript_70257/g.199323 Transcript_70257/m.199323 type:complete len:214 (-) Transcript_70257:437-1078(-)